MIDRQESELVLAAQSGSPDAFGRLVQKYQNMVTSRAFSKTGDLQRSEDIAQQTFMLAWEKRTELREPERFGGWLRSIATNLTLNSNRKSGRLARAVLVMASDSEPASNEVPGDAISSKEQKELLWLTLKKIPEEYREPLILFYREEKSVAQVALVTMIVHCMLRLSFANRHTTLQSQLRNQSSVVLSNMAWSAILFILGGYLGLTYPPVPNWAIALFVLIVGWLCAIAIGYAASKASSRA